LVASAEALRQANAMPSVDALERCAAINPALYSAITGTSSRVAKLVASLSMRYGAPASPFEPDSEDDDLEMPMPPPPEAVYEAVVSAIDAALDQTNTSLDTAAGIANAVAVTLTPKEGQPLEPKPSARRKPLVLDIPKPQLKFPDYPIDNSDTPFVPPSLVANAGVSVVDAHLQTLVRNNAAADPGLTASPHPLEKDISDAAQRMAKLEYQLTDCTLFKPLDMQAVHLIDSEEELFEAAQILHSAPAIAVDLEHHDQRSFQGFTCLIQISTRSQDFLVDAISLRSSIGRALAPVFADPAVVKVLHGANSDVQWLERDFGIHVVNLFDTGQAARLLQYPSKGLSYLLKLFADFDSSQKRTFQIADWRERPLPEPMVEYAICDTHYLLYIYDRLRAELQKKKLLEKAWLKSSSVARIRYAKSRFDPDQHLRLAAKYGLGFDVRQMRVLAELCRWRDTVAREEDESVPFVLSNGSMFAIVRGRDKARNENSLMLILNKMASPVVRKHAERIANLVADTLDAKLPTDKVSSGMTPLKAEEPDIVSAASHRPDEHPLAPQTATCLGRNFAQLSGYTNRDIDASKEHSKVSSKPDLTLTSHKDLPLATAKDTRFRPIQRTLPGSQPSLLDLPTKNVCGNQERVQDIQKPGPDVETSSSAVCKSPKPVLNSVDALGSAAMQPKCAMVSNSSISALSVGKFVAPVHLQPVRESKKSAFMMQDSSSESGEESNAELEAGHCATVLHTPRTGADVLKKLKESYRPVAVVELGRLSEPSAPKKPLDSSEHPSEDYMHDKAPAYPHDKPESDVVAEEYLSLLDSHALDNPVNKKRRGRGPSRTAISSNRNDCDALVVIPYDYQAERKRRESEKSGKTPPAHYSPMSNLMETRNRRHSRVRPARKNPKSGEKSMSFR
jgi:ribonuclease D